MSELQSNHNPEKERKPLIDNCDGCDQDYELTAGNTILNHYSTQDECDHLICNCPNCGYVTMMFIGEKTFQQAVDNGIHVQVEKNAPRNVYDGWAELHEINAPKTYELTNRHEAIIRKFGDTIMNMPPEIFWDNIEAPTEKPYPLRWID